MSIPMKKHQWMHLKNKGVLKESESNLVKDWQKRYCEGTDNKYGCLMYSPSLDRLRHVSFSEFYGGGIID